MGETYHRWAIVSVGDAALPGRFAEQITRSACKLCGMEKVVEEIKYKNGTKDLMTTYSDPRTGTKFSKAGQCPGMRSE